MSPSGQKKHTKERHGDTKARRTKSFLVGDFGEEGLGDEAGDGWEDEGAGQANQSEFEADESDLEW